MIAYVRAAILMALGCLVVVRAEAAGFRDLDGNQFCNADNAPANKYKLARALIDSFKIPISFVDWNDNGVNYYSYARAVSIRLCRDPRDAKAHADKCLVDNDLSKRSPASTAQFNVATEVSTNLDNARAGQRIPVKGWSLSLVINHIATPAQARQSILREADGTLSLSGELFSDDPDFADLICHKDAAKPKPTLPPPGRNEPGSPEFSSADIKADREAVEKHFRLRGTVDDLTIARTDDGFKGASYAKVSASKDGVAQKSTFDLHLAAAYVLPAFYAYDVAVHPLPYFKYDRDYVGDIGSSSKASNINNIGGGILLNMSGFGGSFISKGDYTSSLRSNVKIGRVDLGYTPEPDWLFIGHLTPTGLPGISALASGSALVRFGNVFARSNDDTLANTDIFSQGGGKAGITFFGDENTWLEGFSVPITYTYFYGFVGEYKAIQNFTAAINYTLPQTKYVTIGLSHTSGRDLDTFEKVRLYQLSLGLKF